MKQEQWEKINLVMEEIFAIEPSARKDFLLNTDLDEESLNEIRSLLAFEDEAEDFLSISANDISDKILLPDEFNQNSLIGLKVGVYEIIREIGLGGMGAVYLGERTDGKFSQKVAIKMLRREFNIERIRGQFRREQEIQAKLVHPNIAAILDAGTTDDNIPYLVMEYVEGIRIDEFCNINNLDLDQRLELFREVCLAVDFAHRNLIVHRDLKPSNILVTNDGKPKLLDFGISKILSNEFDQINTATITKLGVMTPSYASPEQLQSKSVTTATDIYSLGIVLYEILSGHRPFETKEENLKEIYKAVIETDPPPPSQLIDSMSKTFKELTNAHTELKDEDISAYSTIVQNFENRTEPNKLRNTLPSKVNLSSGSLRGDLDNIVLKALRKEPERRYLSAGNLSEDIKRHLRGLPVTARPNTFSYRASKFINRNKAGVFATSLIFLAIIGGLIATLWQARVAQSERVKAERHFNDVRSLANSFLFEITPEIENLSGSTRAKELLVIRALKYLDSLSQESGNGLELQRELAAAYEKVGDVQGNPFKANIGDVKGAISSYEKARSIREKLFSGNPSDIKLKSEFANNTQLIGDAIYVSGDIKKASETYKQALKLQKEILEQNPDDSETKFNLASAQYALGATAFWDSELDEALKQFNSAKEVLEKLNQSNPSNEIVVNKLANTYVSIGETYAWQGKLEIAEKEILKGSMTIMPLVEKHPYNAQFRKSLWTANLKVGEVYIDMEKFDKSLDHFNRALELAKITADADPRNVVAKRDLALSFNKVGDTYDSSGNGEDALANAKEALRLQEEIAKADTKNFGIRNQIASTYKRMGYAYTTMKDHEASRKSFQNALQQYEQLSKIDPNDKKVLREIAIVNQTIGQTYLAVAEQSNRNENLKKALDWIEKSLKLLLELKENGSLPEADNELITEIKAEIADTKAKLNKN